MHFNMINDTICLINPRKNINAFIKSPFLHHFKLCGINICTNQTLANLITVNS